MTDHKSDNLFQLIESRRDPDDRLTPADALTLYRSAPWHTLAQRAANLAQRLHPAPIRTFVIERNINYTNACLCRCSFCAFSASPNSPAAWTLTHDQIAEKIKPIFDLGGRQILMQGGLNPNIPFDWYENLLASLKSKFPNLHIHAFSPPELHFFAQHFNIPLPDVIQRLHRAGLDTIPGGGAEILSDRTRHAVSPAKCSAHDWLNVMRLAHQQNICTTATMMFGHLESLTERVEHLIRIRQLQDESLAARHRSGQGGFFTSFTCWPFQPGQTPLAKRLNEPTENQNNSTADTQSHNPADRDPLGGPYAYLKMAAFARLVLDNIPNMQASWVTQGPQIAQLALKSGCNDAGSLMIEENVVAAAGATFALSLDELKSLITTAGFSPAQRDFFYNLI